jgi:hypothetical protein
MDYDRLTRVERPFPDIHLGSEAASEEGP